MITVNEKGDMSLRSSGDWFISYRVKRYFGALVNAN
jgi:hypothetical protein